MVKAQSKLGTVSLSQSFVITFITSLANYCTNAPLSLTGIGAFSAPFTLGGPLFDYNMNIFTYDSSNYPNCSGFTGYEVNQVTVF